MGLLVVNGVLSGESMGPLIRLIKPPQVEKCELLFSAYIKLDFNCFI